MTATNTRAALENIQSKLLAMGGGTKAVIGEPKTGVQSGIVMVIPMGGHVDEVTLTAPREVHQVSIVRLENALQGPEEEIDLRLDKWRAEISEDIWGDFDLGGTIAYALPAETAWEYGHVTYESTLYRYCDITLSFRVDPVAVFTQ